MLPSTIGSFTPVTVAVCVRFQFAVVNVSEAGATVPSVRSLDDNPIVTFAVGWVVKTTRSEAGRPGTEGGSPGVRFHENTAKSLSVLVTDTSDAFKLL